MSQTWVKICMGVYKCCIMAELKTINLLSRRNRENYHHFHTEETSYWDYAFFTVGLCTYCICTKAYLYVHTLLFSRYRHLIFGLNIYLFHQFLQYASIERSCETTRLRRFVWAFADRIYDKCQMFVYWLIAISFDIGSNHICEQWKLDEHAQSWSLARTFTAHVQKMGTQIKAQSH